MKGRRRGLGGDGGHDLPLPVPITRLHYLLNCSFSRCHHEGELSE